MSNEEAVKILYELDDRLILDTPFSKAVSNAVKVSIKSLESTKTTTFGDMLKMFRNLMKQDDIVADYRPNSKMYVDDLENRAGIRIWCKNGDSIVYYPSI